MGRKPNPQIPRKILDEAEHLIHLQGFQGTTMDAIASACQMSKANLFHHYGSKEDLGLAVLDAKILDYQKRRVDPLCAGQDPVSTVETMFLEAGKFFTGNGCKAGCLVANIALEMADVNDTFRQRAGLFFEEWAKGMAACLKRAQAAGYFEAALDPKGTAEAIISLYEGAVLLARTQRDASVFKRVGKAARSLLQQHQMKSRRKTTMGPKTPCGC